MTDRYAVIGNPVAHSKSPQIHAAFARQTGQDIEYARILAPLDGFKAAVEQFRAEGGKGLNVTLPFKHEAYGMAAARSERARQAQAVNTLIFADSQVTGDNTDGVGLVNDVVTNLKFDLRDKRVLLLGAGGASYGVVGPLLAQALQQLVVANRTVAKAVELRKHFAAHAAIEACGYAALQGRGFDLVINATSAGLTGAMPQLPDDVFADCALAYEMVYGKVTPFMQFAQAHGARVADGLGMLVEQAAESFYIWRGVRPQTTPVLEMLRRQG